MPNWRYFTELGIGDLFSASAFPNSEIPNHQLDILFATGYLILPIWDNMNNWGYFPFVLPSESFLSLLVINCMQLFLVLSDASEATLRHWWNICKLYRLYIFFREGHHFVLYVLNGGPTLWHKLHKLYIFLTVNQQTNKCCFQKQQPPNHAWGSVWLLYDLQCISGRQQWGQFGVAVFYSRANHIHSVWVRCPGMIFSVSRLFFNEQEHLNIFFQEDNDFFVVVDFAWKIVEEEDDLIRQQVTKLFVVHPDTTLHCAKEFTLASFKIYSVTDPFPTNHQNAFTPNP